MPAAENALRWRCTQKNERLPANHRAVGSFPRGATWKIHRAASSACTRAQLSASDETYLARCAGEQRAATRMSGGRRQSRSVEATQTSGARLARKWSGLLERHLKRQQDHATRLAWCPHNQSRICRDQFLRSTAETAYNVADARLLEGNLKCRICISHRGSRCLNLTDREIFLRGEDPSRRRASTQDIAMGAFFQGHIADVIGLPTPTCSVSKLLLDGILSERAAASAQSVHEELNRCSK
jgi:hypothetical protein